MANILDRYGIKEVADVVFYDIDNNGKPKNPVLYLDTLKVSTIEQTAEEAEARGGKGNAALIAWDYGKEITVTLEDALFSAKSMAIMFGNGKVKNFTSPETESATGDYIMKTLQYSFDGKTLPTSWISPDGKSHNMINRQFYGANGEKLTHKDAADGASATLTYPKKGEEEEAKSLEVGEKYFCTFDLRASGAVIEVSANSFPGTYYVVGDTFARSEASGLDEMFQFIIPKAKVTSENTITLEAEGDPSVFNMNLKVLRPADGVMMRLVKYSLEGGVEVGENANAELVHNHVMDAKG